MASEGQVFSLNQTVDSWALLGNYSASIDWGDGSTSAASVSPGQSAGGISARIDYSLDSNGFFQASARRQLLQAALDSVADRLADTLTAIQPGSGNNWVANFEHPSQPGVMTNRNNLSIAENELVVFVGAFPMASPQLGRGGFGGFQASGSQAFLNNLQTRGQGNTAGANANEFGPWGGTISFNSSADWYFGADPAGIESGQQDFVTVAVHEFLHLLGFGLSPSWQRLVSGQSFTGSNARAEYDASGNVPLSSDLGHWQFDLEDGGVETLMDPNQLAGLRKAPTKLDMAALRDIGWDLADSSITVSANHTFADNGQYPVSISLSGSRLGRIEHPLNVSVANIAPTLTVPETQGVAAGQPFTLSDLGQISDPGFRNAMASPPTDETFTFTVDWGDDSEPSMGTATIDQIGNASRPTLASFDASHTYLFPGTYVVQVNVSDDDLGSSMRTFSVNVGDAAALSIVAAGSEIFEDGRGQTILTLSRTGGDLSQPLTVSLTSSDTSEATIPANITFAAGEATATVQLQPVDDDLLDGDQMVTITASADGIEPASLDVTVRDAEFVSAEALLAVVNENDGVDAIGFRLSRSNTDTSQPLTVSVDGNDSSLAEVITSVVIPSGQQQTEFRLDVVDDDIAELTKTLTLTFAATGYTGSTAGITILDNEPPKFQNPANPLDVNADGSVFPLDALIIINHINRQNSDAPLDPESDLELPFLDVTGDYFILPLDALQIINAINRGLPGEGEGALKNSGEAVGDEVLLTEFASPHHGWANSVDQLFSQAEEDKD